MEKRLFTSESVTEGHPDKMCDAISDAILDALISQDPMSRVACETAITTGLVLVMGRLQQMHMWISRSLSARLSGRLDITTGVTGLIVTPAA